MTIRRIMGAAMALVLAGGALAAAPTGVQTAHAAGIAPISTAAFARPSVLTQPPVLRINTPGQTATISVRARGGSLRYQWYYLGSQSTTWRAVSGATSPTLRVGATLSKTGYQYRVRISNSRGSVVSRTTLLLVKSTVAQPFSQSQIGATSHWALKTSTRTFNNGDGTTTVVTGIVLANIAKKSRNPKSDLAVKFRASSGAVYSDRNVYGDFDEAGLGTLGSIRPQDGAIAYSVMRVPTNAVSGGRISVQDRSAPIMTLYFKA